MPVDQMRRGKGDIVGEDHLPAMRLDGAALALDIAGNVARGVLVVGSLDVEIRLDPRQQVNRRGGVIDPHPVNEAQCGNHFGPQSLFEHRAVRSLVDVGVVGHRDDQHRALAFGRFQMPDMADMQQIEDAVAQHDCFARKPRARCDCGQFID